jgi:branched-chain amino acid transport system permease protein
MSGAAPSVSPTAPPAVPPAAPPQGDSPVPRRAALVALVLLGIVLPHIGAYPVFLMDVLCFALFAAAFNLLLGYAGLLSFGHAAFFGAAAYACGHALRQWGWPTEAGVLFGVLAATVLGLVMGGLAIRRSGIYFAMITLALAQMLYFVFLQVPFTHGEDGLQEVPRGQLLGMVSLGDDLTLYYVVLAVVVACFLFIERIVGSPFGQVLLAVRDNEPRAISLGYAANRVKLLAFVLSAALAGLAGAMKTVVLGFAALTDAHWTMSGLVILMVLVGGMGTQVGPLVGALIIIGLEHITGISWFSGLGEAVTMVTGLIFVICVMAFRRGVIGELMDAWRRRRGNLGT